MYFIEIEEESEREKETERRTNRYDGVSQNWTAYIIEYCLRKKKRKKETLDKRQNFSGKTERRTKGALFKTKTK